jgi:hypothetical protein
MRGMPAGMSALWLTQRPGRSAAATHLSAEPGARDWFIGHLTQ